MGARDRGIVHGSPLTYLYFAEAKSARAVFHVPSFASTADKAGSSETALKSAPADATGHDLMISRLHAKTIEDLINGLVPGTMEPCIKFPVSNSGK